MSIVLLEFAIHLDLASFLALLATDKRMHELRNPLKEIFFFKFTFHQFMLRSDVLNRLVLGKVYSNIAVIIIDVELLPIIRVRDLMDDHVAFEIARKVNIRYDHSLKVSFNDTLVESSILIRVEH